MHEISMLDIFAVLSLLAAMLCLLLAGKPRYLHDDKRRHARYCAKCHQQQVRVGTFGIFSDAWWETVGPINNKNCDCHKDVE